jgi:hypothetical protein
MQRQYVEKPAKVLAEQYSATADPPAAGVHTCTLPPFLDGRPHVHCVDQARELHDGDMILASVYDPGVFLDVVPLAEFEDRFGNVPG